MRAPPPIPVRPTTIPTLNPQNAVRKSIKCKAIFPPRRPRGWSHRAMAERNDRFEQLRQIRLVGYYKGIVAQDWSLVNYFWAR
jgi:hypothetical protein